jgi:DNA-binding IclR family transcriptional regulator
VLEKAIAILQCFSHEHPTWSITELSQRFGYSKATVCRILRVLAQNRLLFQDPESRRYTLGIGIQELVQRQLWLEELKATAFGVMRNLRDLTRETACLYHWSTPLEFTCILRVDSPNVIRPVEHIGRPILLGRGATSRVILSFQWEQAGVEGLRRLLEVLPDGALAVPMEQLVEEVIQTAQNGFASTAGERYPDTASIAAPVRDGRGRGIAVLTLFGPLSRLNVERRLSLVPAVVGAAAEITRRLNRG